MSTLTIEKSSNMVNFLTNSKTINWRYQKLMDIAKKTLKQEMVYWIGIIDLSQITEKDDCYPIAYNYVNGKMLKDKHLKRDKEGIPTTPFVVYYNISKIKEDLLKEKAIGNNFFQVFIEEVVEITGFHTVSILFKESSPKGIGTKKPWPLEPAKDWLAHSSIKIDEETQRIYLLSVNRFNWK